MNKIFIAKELLKNTTNIYLKEFITSYIVAVEENNINDDCDMSLLKFNKCVEYLLNTQFDITGWSLWEIPIDYAYCFYNKDMEKRFDLNVYSLEDKVEPTYLDRLFNENKAPNIYEAIEKYHFNSNCI